MECDFDYRYENNEAEIKVIEVCEHCGEDINAWEEYYEFPSGSIIHDECVIDYIHQFKQNI